MQREGLTNVFCNFYINYSLLTNTFQCTHKWISAGINVKYKCDMFNGHTSNFQIYICSMVTLTNSNFQLPTLHLFNGDTLTKSPNWAV